MGVRKLSQVAVVLTCAGWLRAQTARPRFVDVTAKSAFAYTTRNGFDGKRKYFPQPLCGGVAAFDFDNDGLIDLFFTNGAPFPSLIKSDSSFHNALLRNKGGGVFEDVTARAGLAGETLGYSLGVAAADYDNDGLTDLFIANAGSNTLYRNNGDGTFKDVTAQTGLGAKPAGVLSVQGAWIDYDNDGRLDLVLSNYTTWTVATDKRCVREDGVDFYCHPKTYPPVAHRLYRNTGGKFEDVTDAAGLGKRPGKGMGIGVADFNGDGRPDIFIANDTERNFLFQNRGNGTFEERGLQAGVAYNDDAATVSAMGADARDYDNDGWPDIFYNDLTTQIWGLFRNLAGRTFRYVSPAAGLAQLSAPYSGWSAGFLDYNNDGWKDIYSANGDVDSLRAHAAQHDTLFENAAGKRFIDVTGEAGEYFARTGYQRGSVFADLDNNGFVDIVVTSLGRKPSILLNGGLAAGAHWIGVRLTGTKSNRDSIGARVKVTTASGRVLHDWVSPSTGFLSSSSIQLHFGLGPETKVVEVETRWPSGAAARAREPAVDRVLRMEEPR